jgi:hypothetical protein
VVSSSSMVREDEKVDKKSSHDSGFGRYKLAKDEQTYFKVLTQ